MTLLGRRSEPRHISPFQFPIFSPFISFSLYLPPSLISLLSFYVIPPPTTPRQHHSSGEAKMPVDVVSVWPEAWRCTPCLIEDEAEGKRSEGQKGKRKKKNNSTFVLVQRGHWRPACNARGQREDL